MAWIYILIASILETIWPFTMKWVEQFSKAGPMALLAALAVPVAYCLNEAIKHLPAGTVYATFIGISTISVAIIGMGFFHESTAAPRLISLAFVIAGLIGLKFYS
jgi:quaternary ammonium compound-resistance protein SugE